LALICNRLFPHCAQGKTGPCGRTRR
jgi:hypothetical protein